MDYVTNNMQRILDVTNSELASYGLRGINLSTIMLTNCMGDTYDARFIFGASSSPSKDLQLQAFRIAKSVLLDFVSQYVPGTYTMRNAEYVFYF